MTLIKNGTIVDGSGKPAYVGDVLVEGDRIVDIIRGAESAEIEPDEIVDASGKLVTPGFIDAHAHSDAYLVLEGDAPSKITQGITTEINGQCGGSIAPRYGEARLSSDWAAVLGDRLCWRTLGEYREILAASRCAVNTVQFIGHNTIRSSVIGYAAKKADADDMRAMVAHLERAMDEGGWGLSTGLVYPPGKYSTPEEVRALASVCAAKGGLYATHMRSEGDRLLESIDEVIELAQATGIKAEISHFKTSGRENWGKLEPAIAKIESAIERGLLLGSDRYPYCAAGTDLDIVLDDDGSLPERDWSSVMIGGTWHPESRRYSGRFVSDICVEEKTDPEEFIFRILKLDGNKTGGFFFGMSEDNLSRILSLDWIVPGSDASLRAPWGPLGNDHPHPRAYATMSEFYRRVRSIGISREDAIARMTSVPADRFGIARRGRIAKGMYADIVIWDEENFKAKSTFDAPHRFCEGVSAVMVNGGIVYADGKFTGQRSGRFLER